jgi:hypothetical protein
MFLPFLYVSSSEKVAELKVTRIDGQEVFFYSAFFPGERFSNDRLFLLHQGVPQRLDTASVLQEAIKKLIPEGFSLDRRRDFNWETLTLSNTISDRSRAAAGGIRIVLGIESGRLIVKSSEWRKTNGVSGRRE